MDRPPHPFRVGDSAAPCRRSGRRRQRRPAAPGSGHRRSRRHRASRRRTRTCSIRSGRAARRQCRRCGLSSCASPNRHGSGQARHARRPRTRQPRSAPWSPPRSARWGRSGRCRSPPPSRRSTGHPDPGGRCCGIGTTDRRDATERRRAGSPTARSNGIGWRLAPDGVRRRSRSTRSGRRSTPESPGNRCPRAADTGRR